MPFLTQQILVGQHEALELDHPVAEGDLLHWG